MQATLTLPNIEPLVLNLPDYLHRLVVDMPPAQRSDAVVEALSEGFSTMARAPREIPEAAAVLLEVLRTGKDTA